MLKNLKFFFIWLIPSIFLTGILAVLFQLKQIHLLRDTEKAVIIMFAVIIIIFPGIVFINSGIKKRDAMDLAFFWFAISLEAGILIILFFNAVEFHFEFKHFDENSSAIVLGALTAFLSGVLIFIIRFLKKYIGENFKLYSFERIILWFGISISLNILLLVYFDRTGIDVFDIDEDFAGLFVGLLTAVTFSLFLLIFFKGKDNFSEIICYFIGILISVNLIVLFFLSPDKAIKEELQTVYRKNLLPVIITSSISIIILISVILNRIYIRSQKSE